MKNYTLSVGCVVFFMKKQNISILRMLCPCCLSCFVQIFPHLHIKECEGTWSSVLGFSLCCLCGVDPPHGALPWVDARGQPDGNGYQLTRAMLLRSATVPRAPDQRAISVRIVREAACDGLGFIFIVPFLDRWTDRLCVINWFER